MLYSFLLEGSTKRYAKYRELTGADPRAIEYANADIKRRFDKANADSASIHNDAVATRIQKDKEFEKAHKSAKKLRKYARLSKAIQYGLPVAGAALSARYGAELQPAKAFATLIPSYLGHAAFNIAPMTKSSEDKKIGQVGFSLLGGRHKKALEAHHNKARELQNEENKLRRQYQLRNAQQKMHRNIYDKLNSK